jgi:hypothetical protein
MFGAAIPFYIVLYKQKVASIIALFTSAAIPFNVRILATFKTLYSHYKSK